VYLFSRDGASLLCLLAAGFLCDFFFLPARVALNFCGVAGALGALGYGFTFEVNYFSSALAISPPRGPFVPLFFFLKIFPRFFFGDGCRLPVLKQVPSFPPAFRFFLVDD